MGIDYHILVVSCPDPPLCHLIFLCMSAWNSTDTTCISLPKEFIWPFQPSLPTYAVRNDRELTSRKQPSTSDWELVYKYQLTCPQMKKPWGVCSSIFPRVPGEWSSTYSWCSVIKPHILYQLPFLCWLALWICTGFPDIALS